MMPAVGAAGALIEAVAEKSPGRRWPQDGSSRIPNWVYTDPEIFAREQERVFEGAGWLYVCLEAEIPNPGDFVRSRLGAKEVVTVRDPAGAVNVLVNRCAHRSAQFCSAARGTAKEFVCPYHQWTYDLGGALLGVPFRRGYRGQGGMPADFEPQQHGLQRLRVTCRHGLVFASFSAETEPFDELSRRQHARLFRPRLRRPRTRRARPSAPAHPKQLEADVREHQGPVPREPAARVPGDLRPLPPRSAIGDRDGPDRAARGAGQPQGRAAAERGDPADARVQIELHACAIRGSWSRCASSPARPRW